METLALHEPQVLAGDAFPVAGAGILGTMATHFGQDATSLASEDAIGRPPRPDVGDPMSLASKQTLRGLQNQETAAT